jgi:hypothetical protein
MAEEEKPEDDKKVDPWQRIGDIVRTVVGEELSKWETESPNNSQHSSEEKKEEEAPSPDQSKSSPRKMGFLSKAFGIME